MDSQTTDYLVDGLSYKQIASMYHQQVDLKTNYHNLSVNKESRLQVFYTYSYLYRNYPEMFFRLGAFVWSSMCSEDGQLSLKYNYRKIFAGIAFEYAKSTTSHFVCQLSNCSSSATTRQVTTAFSWAQSYVKTVECNHVWKLIFATNKWYSVRVYLCSNRWKVIIEQQLL